MEQILIIATAAIKTVVPYQKRGQKSIIYEANIDFDIAGYINKNITITPVKQPLKNALKVMKSHSIIPAGSYLFKANNRNTITRCEICSKLTLKTPERHH